MSQCGKDKRAATSAVGCREAGQSRVHQSRQEEELENPHPTESGGDILGAELQLLGVPLTAESSRFLTHQILETGLQHAALFSLCKLMFCAF